MWKQSCGDWRGSQLRKHGQSRSVKWQKRNLHLFQLSSRWIHAANRWIPYPSISTKKQQPKQVPLVRTKAFDQWHIFAFRVRFLWTPALSWIRICVNMSVECVNSTTEGFCSENVGCALLMPFCVVSAKVSLNEKLQKITTQVSWCVFAFVWCDVIQPGYHKNNDLFEKIDHIYSYEH